MKRLEAFRDGLDELIRAIREGRPAQGISGERTVLEWAHRDLSRLAYAEYDVQSVEEGSYMLSSRVRFTVGGFREDGTRVERSAVLTFLAEILPPAHLQKLAVESDGWVSRTKERAASFARFRDATADSGLGAPRLDPKERVGNLLIEGIWPGSGAAILDYNGDGIDDLFVGDGQASILYEHDGCGRFRDVTVKAGLAGPPVPATGVAAADYDGDGFDDLFVTNNFAPSRLFHNRGDGTFEDVTERARVGASHRSRSAAFADVNGDGWLDLFVCSTGDYYRQMPDPPYDARDGGPNRLFLGSASGVFTDATESFGLAQTRWSLTAQFADLDDDGFPDLIVTNDFGIKNIYHNNSGRGFADIAARLGAEDRAYGMSATVADFNGDGRLDLHFTGCYTQWGLVHDFPSLPLPLPGRIFLPIAISWSKKMCRGNSLLLNRDAKFEDVTERSGLGAAGWCWSGVAGDLDNDGRMDVYAANGMWDDGRPRGDRELEFWWETLAYWDDYIAGARTFQRDGKGVHGCERNRYFRNRGDGVFEDASFLDGVDLPANSRAVLLSDFDGDGSLDIYVRSVQHPETLFLGTRSPGEHFVELRLSQKGPNRAAIGGRITLTTPDGRVQVQEIQTTSGFLASATKKLHFGLGSQRTLQSLKVRWPDRTVEDFTPPAFLDGVFVLERGTGQAKLVPRVVPTPRNDPREGGELRPRT